MNVWYSIFTYIYPKTQLNVGKYIMTMDPMGDVFLSLGQKNKFLMLKIRPTPVEMVRICDDYVHPHKRMGIPSNRAFTGLDCVLFFSRCSIAYDPPKTNE